MCDIGKALSRAFGAPGTGALLNNLQGQQAQAEQASDTAASALTDALQRLQDASTPAIDNPFSIAAKQAQQRKLQLQQGGAASFAFTPTVAPMTGTKMLMGA